MSDYHKWLGSISHISNPTREEAYNAGAASKRIEVIDEAIKCIQEKYLPFTDEEINEGYRWSMDLPEAICKDLQKLKEK